MIKISTQQKKVPVIIKQVNPFGYHHLDIYDQQVYDELKAYLDALMVQPSAACVQEILRYGEFAESKG